MENFQYALEGAWKVLLAGVILGAGLPAVFALGIRSLAIGEARGDENVVADSSSLGKALAALCFLVVVLAVAVGITIVVASGLGKEVSFSHVFPVVKDKG